jgi:hypothetical protein
MMDPAIQGVYETKVRRVSRVDCPGVFCAW